MSVTLHEVVTYLDERLDIAGVEDASVNGLQLQAGDSVQRVAVAVDAALATIGEAAERGADLLLVHHGLLWGEPRPLRDNLGARVGACFGAGLSVYAAHLPLDLHPELGNNALLARRLGAEPEAGFASIGGADIGVVAGLEEPLPLAELAGRLAAAGCDEQILWAFGPDPVSRIAVLTGAGCSALDEAVAAGADCFVTGEPRQATYHEARERGINCLFAGHYATETFGVRAVGEDLERRFGIEIVWIDHPTGV